MIRQWATAVLLSITVLGAQQKALTRDQKKFREQFDKWSAQTDLLRSQARTAFVAENLRAKADPCPDAKSTVDEEDCLKSETGKTQANYDTFAKSIRALLALPYPTVAGEEPASGPTGTPLTTQEMVTEFNRLEVESARYRQHASTAAYNRYKGGTLAPVFSAEANLRLIRLHMQELDFIYGALVSGN